MYTYSPWSQYYPPYLSPDLLNPSIPAQNYPETCRLDGFCFQEDHTPMIYFEPLQSLICSWEQRFIKIEVYIRFLSDYRCKWDKGLKMVALRYYCPVQRECLDLPLSANTSMFSSLRRSESMSNCLPARIPNWWRRFISPKRTFAGSPSASNILPSSLKTPPSKFVCGNTGKSFNTQALLTNHQLALIVLRSMLTKFITGSKKMKRIIQLLVSSICRIKCNKFNIGNKQNPCKNWFTVTSWEASLTFTSASSIIKSDSVCITKSKPQF